MRNFEVKKLENYQKKGLIHEKTDYTFTDKTLDNFFYIGLIKKIFPNAKIIDCSNSNKDKKIINFAINFEFIIKLLFFNHLKIYSYNLLLIRILFFFI